jgi:hypothetical protein
MFRSLKWATLLLVNVMFAPLGGLLALPTNLPALPERAGSVSARPL